ncbi:MAG: lipocalin-like domain-containing protein [Chitinophagaceae bacterium]
MKILAAVVFLIFVLSCQTTNNKPEAESENKLAGSWKFIADQLMDSSSNVIKQDTAVSGLLIYTPDGKVSVQFLWKGTRAPVLNDTLMNKDGMSTGLGLGFNTWNTEEARRLIDTYDAYFGDYRVDWNASTVTHIVKGSLRPEKEGTVHQRIFQLKADSLFLRSADPGNRWRAACVRVNGQ